MHILQKLNKYIKNIIYFLILCYIYLAKIRIPQTAPWIRHPKRRLATDILVLRIMERWVTNILYFFIFFSFFKSLYKSLYGSHVQENVSIGADPDEFLTRMKLEVDGCFMLYLFLFVARSRFKSYYIFTYYSKHIFH